MMAPVAGSGSWPAWMQRVEKRASGVSFTRRLYLPAARARRRRRAQRQRHSSLHVERAAAAGVRAPRTIDIMRPDLAWPRVSHVLSTRSAADGPGVAAAGAAAPLPAAQRGRPRA